MLKIFGLSKDISHVLAIRYGRLTEEKAKIEYEKIISKDHSDVVVNNCGLFVERCNMFLSASPDLLVSCSCCGEGLVEIKCPYTNREISPLSKPSTFLSASAVDGRLRVETNHQYYTQMQGQLGVTGRSWCDIFVYSEKGHFMQRIGFDKAFWLTLMLKLVHFFQDKVFPRFSSKG